MIAYIKKKLAAWRLKRKQANCAHQFGDPQISEAEKALAEWKRVDITIPGTDIKLPVMQREYPAVQTCGVCGFDQRSLCRDQKNTPEQDEVTAAEDAAHAPQAKPEKTGRFRHDKLRKRKDK